MKIIPMPFAHRTLDGTEIRVRRTAGVAVRLALSSASVIQDDIRNARNALRLEGRDSAFQLCLRAEVRAGPAILTVAAHVIIIVRIVAHGKTATGGLLRHGKPDPID